MENGREKETSRIRQDLFSATAPDGTKLIFSRFSDETWVLTGNGHTIASGNAECPSVDAGIRKFRQLSSMPIGGGLADVARLAMPSHQLSYDLFN